MWQRLIGKILENKEGFVNEPKEDDASPEFILRRGPDGKSADKKIANKEQFTIKKKVTFGDIIDSILTFILVVIFIIFMGNLAYICFFQDNDNDGLFI